MGNTEKINIIIDKLNAASDAYYLYDKPIMTDKEYDDLLDQLESLEKETGIVMSNSPLHKVQGKILPGLNKVTHSKPMLSSNKTKDINKIQDFIDNRKVMVSYKEDGLTLVVRYSSGKLIQAITRGSGIEGEDVTEQAKMITNIPLEIPFNGKLELRGECVISWENFNRINELLEEPYSHPRNLAAGSLRTLDINITRVRKLEYIVFELVSYNEDKTYRAFNFRSQSLDWLDSLGFKTVERILCRSTETEMVVKTLTAENSKYPVDGLIFNYEDLSYAASLGSTSHHPLDMIALKWANETFETELLDIEWNTTRTGRINPTAVFKPVIIEGSSVSRATVHNISIMEELKLGKGDTITIYKSNQIIPAIDENLTMSGTFTPPSVCPCCGEPTEIHNENGSKTLHCINPDCQAKLLSKLEHACGREALNIENMSEATLDFLINKGWIKSLNDIFFLGLHQEDWVKESGFGEKSVLKLLDNIEKSKNTTLERFIYAQSIPLIGRSASRDIAKMCGGDIDTFCKIMSSGIARRFLEIDGFGEMMYKSLMNWHDAHWIEFLRLKNNFTFSNEKREIQKTSLEGKTFVITGSLVHFKNRDELIEKILSLDGKVSGSVSTKTTYLINNDVNSTSGKNAKAKQVGCTIISESDFLKMIGEQ